MATITFDFSTERITHPQGSENSPFVFKDIGTSNIKYYVDSKTGKETVNDVDTSNIDANAVKASLNNILSFRTGDAILNPEFGIGRIYEMLYMPFDKYTTQKMMKEIKDIINTYEPRIEIISTPVEYNEDKQEYLITLNYYIPALLMNDSFQMSLKQ